MSIITLTTDFGLRDYYVASLKAKILSILPDARIIDISHQITPYNISHAAFVLGAVFREFPEKSVHVLAVNSHSKANERYIAIKLENHYLVGPDNGVFSLLGDKQPSEIIEIAYTPESANGFIEKNVFLPIACELAKGTSIFELGKQILSIQTKFNRQIRLTKNTIDGKVIHIDHYGNLITNISKEDFERFRNNRSFEISFGRETTNTLAETYGQYETGDCVALFNSLNLLELSINSGNACQLFGMKLDSDVKVQFTPAIEAQSVPKHIKSKRTNTLIIQELKQEETSKEEPIQEITIATDPEF